MIAAVILVGIMLYFGMFPAPSSILLVPLSLLTALLALGVGMWLAALNVRYRDVQHATPFLMQIWMFATPVVYPGSLVPESYRAWFHLNPMAGIICRLSKRGSGNSRRLGGARDCRRCDSRVSRPRHLAVSADGPILRRRSVID